MRRLLLAATALVWIGGTALAQDAGEISFWDSVKDSKNAAELQAYVEAYPQGKFVPLARIRIQALGGAAGAAGAAAPAQPTAAPQQAPAPAATTTTAKPGKARPQIMADKESYPPLEPIKITWANLPTSLGYSYLVLYGADGTELYRISVDSRSQKDATFEGRLPGTYEVRLITGAYDSPFVVAKTKVTVAEQDLGANAPGVATDAAVYPPLEPITVTWSNLPASLSNGWIALRNQGSDTDLLRQSVTFNDKVTKSITFEGRLPGAYDVIVLSPPYGSEFVVAKTSFTVEDPNAADEAAAAEAQTQVPAEQAQGAAGAEQGAAPRADQTTVVTAGPVTLDGGGPTTNLGKVALPAQASVSTAAESQAVIAGTAKKSSLTCGQTESYSWPMPEADQSRLDAITSSVERGLRGNGYALTQVEAADPSSQIAYTAVGPNDKILAAWYFKDTDLILVLCPIQ